MYLSLAQKFRSIRKRMLVWSEIFFLNYHFIFILYNMLKQINIMGTMYFWDLTIDIVTTMFLVLAVGLSVDYASHIGHMFMTIAGPRMGKPLPLF